MRGQGIIKITCSKILNKNIFLLKRKPDKTLKNKHTINNLIRSSKFKYTLKFNIIYFERNTMTQSFHRRSVHPPKKIRLIAATNLRKNQNMM